MGSITFDYQGIALRFDPESEMGSLTAMHDAAGHPDNKEPARWARTDTAKEFIRVLATKLNYPEKDIYISRPGRDGGTWAHWQIGMEYARYLDPMLAIHWNECIVAYKTGTPAHSTPLSSDLLGALRDHGERGIALHRRLVESCDAVVCNTVEIDEHTRAFQAQIAPMLEGAQRRMQKSKEGWFYIILPDGDHPENDVVYVKIGKAKDEEVRLDAYRVGNSGIDFYLKVPAIDFDKCEVELRKRIPSGFKDWRDRDTIDHFHRMDRDFLSQLVTFLRDLDGPLTVKAIKDWRLTGMYRKLL